MKALVLSSHPLVDTVPYKGNLLAGLDKRGLEVRVLYSSTSISAYYREARRRGLAQELMSRMRVLRERQSGNGERGQTLREAVAALGVETISFQTLVEPACLRFVEAYGPDIVHNVSALYIPPPFLEVAERVVGAHYADLPRLRGVDTIRWSILLDHQLVTTHILLAAALDLGDILTKTPVRVHPGEDVGAVRRTCQQMSAEGHLRVVDLLRSGELRPEPQRQDQGSTFSRMGNFLRERVDEILRHERYSHYV